VDDFHEEAAVILDMNRLIDRRTGETGKPERMFTVFPEPWHAGRLWWQ
jgi:hypothetical protein